MIVECLFLVLTARCNLSCRYCYQNAKKDQRMEWQVLRAGMDLAFGAESPEITVVFSGGEPLLEFDLMQQALEYAENAGRGHKRLRYMLCTNGLLISGTVADFLEKYQFKVQLSLDGVSQAQDYRGESTFQTLDRVLDLMRAGTPNLFRDRLRISMTVIPSTIRYLPDSVAYLLGKGVREIGISPGMILYPGWCAETVGELEEKIGVVADISRRHLDQTGEVPVTFLRKGRERGPRQNPAVRECNAMAARVLALDADGQMYTCPMFAQSYQSFPPDSRMAGLNMFQLGDVRDPESAMRYSTLPAALRTLNLSASAEARYSYYGKCPECEYSDRCYVCPASMWHAPESADPFRAPDFICAFNRMTLQCRDRFPAMPVQARHSEPIEGDPIVRLEEALRARHRLVP